jgi:hypothetical protein
MRTWKRKPVWKPAETTQKLADLRAKNQADLKKEKEQR